jgi:localization factor PodJL
MAEGVVQITPSSDGPRERKAIRAAIIAAARAVAEREGVEAVSLGKVAVESGLERATVFQLFTRKEDLLTAIVSEDVATLASTMRNVDAPAGEANETPDSAVIVPMTRQGEAAERPTEVVGLARDVSTAMAQTPAPTVASAAGDRMRARRAELMRMLDNVATEEGGEMKADGAVKAEPVDETPEPADGRLEGRLREFERAMTAMENRHAQAEKNSKAASVAAEEHIKVLEETIRELRERADGAEARSSSSEVRAALVEGNATEAPVADVAPAQPDPAPVEPPPMAVEAEPVPTPVAEAPKDDAPKSTLAQMRRTGLAANAAAAAALDASAKKKPDAQKAVAQKADAQKADALKADAQKIEAPKPDMKPDTQKVHTLGDVLKGETQNPEPKSQAKARRNHTTRYAVAGSVLVLALVVAGGIAFSKGVYDGRHEALAQQAAPPAPTVIAMATPHLVVPPHQTALDQLTTRAQAGDAAAEYAIAAKYLHGTDTAKDPTAALHWLTLAAVHGQPVAQYMLGSLYQQGLGAPADPAKALQWYEASALQGNRRAMHNLGIAFAQGLGTEKNMPEAVRWFSRAAAMGYVDSQFNLAVLYERGDGVPQSLLDAYKWYVVASRQGDAESKQRVDALKTQLNPDDLTAAQHAADAFRPMPTSDSANVPPAG